MQFSDADLSKYFTQKKVPKTRFSTPFFCVFFAVQRSPTKNASIFCTFYVDFFVKSTVKKVK